jgi:hypothetical protein
LAQFFGRRQTEPIFNFLSFAKIPIFSKHWTSLFTPDTVGLMIHALLAFVSAKITYVEFWEVTSLTTTVPEHIYLCAKMRRSRERSSNLSADR